MLVSEQDHEAMEEGGGRIMYTAKIVQKWSEKYDKEFNVWTWSPNSPYVNLIAHQTQLSSCIVLARQLLLSKTF